MAQVPNVSYRRFDRFFLVVDASRIPHCIGNPDSVVFGEKTSPDAPLLHLHLDCSVLDRADGHTARRHDLVVFGEKTSLE